MKQSANFYPTQISESYSDEEHDIKTLTNLTKQQFKELEKSFSKGSIDVSTFVDIFQSVVENVETIQLVYLFQLIDIQERKLITFEQFSNFLVEMHDWFNYDYNPKSKLKQEYKSFNRKNPIEKLFDLGDYDGIAILEQNLRQLKILNLNFEEQLTISIGQITIINVVYIKQMLLISSNDRFLNFFDLQTNKLSRRFMTPFNQTFIQYIPDKQKLYTASDSGLLFSWNLDVIMSKDFYDALKDQREIQNVFKLALKNDPLQLLPSQQQDKSLKKNYEVRNNSLTCILLIDSLEVLVTGSNDGIIRLFEDKEQLLPHKCLRGHKKAIKNFTYCQEYKYLISCSYEFYILVWNIYLEHPLAKLHGHESSIVSVLSMDNSSLILSCDTEGIIRLWDPKTYQSIQQLKLEEAESNVRSIIQKKNTVIVGYQGLSYYEFEQQFEPTLTDDIQIQFICYADKYLEVHLATIKAIKTWDLKSGTLKRIFMMQKQTEQYEIQSFCIDAAQRKGFIGTHQGIVICIDLFLGCVLREFRELTKEVSYLCYSNSYNLLIAASWDKSIVVCKDIEKIIQIRSIKNAHPNEITIGGYSENLLLLATSGRQNELRIWDFEKSNLIARLRTTGEVISIKFLDQFPLLLITDHLGNLIIYMMPPNEKEFKVITIWKNMYTVIKSSPINAVDYTDEQIIIGDENGDIRVLSYKEILVQLKIKPISHQEIIINRNPLRLFQYTLTDDGKIFQEQLQPLLNERSIYQLSSWKVSKTPVKQIQLARETKQLVLITIACDFLVKLWDLNGVLLGTLIQGTNPQYKIKIRQNYRTKTEQLLDHVNSQQRITDSKRLKLQRAFMKESETDSLKSIDSMSIFQTLKDLEKHR